MAARIRQTDKKTEARTEKYSREQEIRNTKKMREILEELPRFCRQYFRGIEESTGARTRLAYAYDLRVFFEFLEHENRSLKGTAIRDYPISILEQIGKEDIEEFLEYLSYYEKDGQIFTNDARGKARKLSAVRSMFKYFYTSEILQRDVSALVPLPKLREKPIVRLDADEVNDMLDKADSGAQLTKNQLRFHDKTRLRDMALLTLLLGTGIRVSECVGLDLDDIDFKEKGIRVHRKGGYESIVYFGDEVESAIREYLGKPCQKIRRTGHISQKDHSSQAAQHLWHKPLQGYRRHISGGGCPGTQGRQYHPQTLCGHRRRPTQECPKHCPSARPVSGRHPDR